MTRILCSTLMFLGMTATVAAGPRPNTLAESELAEGWILLFDGESLFGWKASSDANWKAADGAITANEGKPGLLCTTSRFANYELKFDFRVEPGANSGVFLRTIANPIRADLTTKCYEVNISGSAGGEWPTGSIVDRQKPTPVTHDTQWQTLDITIDRGRLLVKLNGRTTADYTDPKPIERGLIGLQFHTGKVAFRNVKLRPLGTKSLFNGKDLAGWKPYPGLPSVFSVTPEGWLSVRNGKGQLETEGRYADFTLQLEVFVNGLGLNSGIFFRSIPGDLWMGYESQIHNGYKDGDRTQPADCGTGGIFRRQNARRVVADDFAWFHQTIHVDGPHMAVWVNGYQVSDWTDRRPPHKNPRKGLRLAPGTIIIQGHDPTTDLRFRNLRIATPPIPPF